MYQKSRQGQRGFKARSLEEFLEICNRNFAGTTLHLLWPEIEYKNSGSFITVYCSKHRNTYRKRGIELQQGAGCPDCGRDRMCREKKVRLNKQRISEATEKYAGKFDYSLFDLETSGRDKSTVICPVHGELQMQMEVHLRGSFGCRQCYYESKDAVTNREEFMSKARRVRQDFNDIDYSEFEYKSSLEKSKFRCKIHNLWYEQTPGGHFDTSCGPSAKNGCTECKALMLSSGSAAFNNYKDLIKKPAQAYRPCYVYAVFLEYYEYPERERLKVGISNVDCIEKRMSTLKREFGCDSVVVLGVLKSTRIDCVVIERHIHKALVEYKLPIKELSGKRVGGRTEVFHKSQIDTVLLVWKDLTEIYKTTEEVNYYGNHPEA